MAARRLTRRNTESALIMPTLRRTLVVLARAFRLRCPHCGRGRVLAPLRAARDWGRVRSRCVACGLAFDRGDESYFSGSMFTNLALAEGLFVVGFAAAVWATWPDVPWEPLTYAGAVVVGLAPVVLYPLSKVLWLAMDVLVRPVTPNELRRDRADES